MTRNDKTTSPVAARPAGTGGWVEKNIAWLLLVPAVLLVLGLAILPAVSSFLLSFQNRRLSAGAQVDWIGLGNYAQWLADPRFWSSLRLTIIWTVGAVALQLLAGLGVALLLNRKFPGRGLLRGLILIPWVLPIVSTANIWVWLFNEFYGFIDVSLMAMGVIKQPIAWLSSPDLAIYSAVMVKAWRDFPFAALMLTAGLQTIPNELYEAAKLDGANAWQQFWHVTLPGLRLVILVILLLQTIWTFNDVSTIYLLTRGGPGNATETLSILVYKTSFATGDLSRGAAGSILMFIVVGVLIATYFRLYSRSEAQVRG